MAAARATCLLLVTLAACQDLPPPADGIRSGSRLRARFLADDEGARVFEAFHDRELGVDCTFRGDPPRCLPEVGYVRSYRDSGCTEPLFGRGAAAECRALPDFIGVALAVQCPDGDEGFRQIWRRGERVTPETVYVLEAGACVAQAARVDYEYYAADVEIPVEGLVAATYEVSGEGRLRDVVRVGDDGSRQPVGFHDEALGAECTYDEDLGLCVPEFGLQDLWSDAGCSVPIAGVIPSPCTPVPRFIGRYEPSLAVFERGPEAAPNPVYTGADAASCGWRPADPSISYYRAGDDVVGDLAELDRVAGDDRRLQVYYVVDGEGSQQRVDGFHDRVRNFDCEPVQTGPDRWHCVPPFGSTATRLFADPLCEREIDVLERRPDDPEAPAKPRRGIVWRPSGEDACELHAHLFERGDELASGTLYVPRLLGCQRLTWNPAEVRRFALGPEMSFDDYVRLRRVTE